jgi:hypothetical protein
VCARRQTSSGGLEKKAWATSATAKCMQGEFLCLAHNLMVLHEDLLLREHGIVNEAENRRREKRLKKEQETARKAGRAVPLLRQALQRCTQRTVKFVRWLRGILVPRRALDGHPRRPEQGLPHTVAEITDTVAVWARRQTSSRGARGALDENRGRGGGTGGTVVKKTDLFEGRSVVKKTDLFEGGQKDRPLRGARGGDGPLRWGVVTFRSGARRGGSRGGGLTGWGRGLVWGRVGIMHDSGVEWRWEVRRPEWAVREGWGCDGGRSAEERCQRCDFREP